MRLTRNPPSFLEDFGRIRATGIGLVGQLAGQQRACGAAELAPILNGFKHGFGGADQGLFLGSRAEPDGEGHEGDRAEVDLGAFLVAGDD